MNLTYKDFVAFVSDSLKGGVTSLSVAALAAVGFIGTTPAIAALLDVFIIADHSAPTGGTAPLSITTETVYKLNLRPDGRSRSAEKLTDSEKTDHMVDTITVDSGLTFNNDNYNNGVNFDRLDRTDQLSPEGDPNLVLESNQGEAFYYNSQAATWDNVNIRDASYTYDPTEQIDFGRNAPVIFNPVQGGFTELLVAELGGLNTFDLWICEDADCNVGQSLFGGLTNSLSTSLFATPDFALEDSADESQLDQTWLFRFDAPVTGYARLLEEDSRRVYDRSVNDRLQVDFVGVGGISAVPVPTSLPLLAGGLGLLGVMMRWRRKT